MKILRFLFAFYLLLTVSFFAEAIDAKKPKIMVFPSDDWCIRKGYVVEGTIPDYEKALQDPDMDGAVAVMGDVMAEQGYEMFSLKQELKQIHTEDAYGIAVQSKDDGSVMESERDLITRNVGADFIVELSLDNKPFGARKSIEFKAQTIDAASKKILHGDIGTSSASSAPTPILVKEAVGGFIENFCHKIDLAFTNIEENGREGSITFKIADDCPLNFESNVRVDGESGELAEYITYWIEEHAVNGNCSLNQKSRETLRYDQVRFPLVSQVASGGFGSKKGKTKAQTMETFISPIAKELDRFNISMTTVPIGQGSAYIVLGGK
ncbi:MAG: hypothetical protein J1F43_03600 [Muribaculaceae bacterium]|nr:hypothetical protein [Muribaculaceae bacterium]